MEEGGRQAGPGPHDRAVLEQGTTPRRRGLRAWAWKVLGVSKVVFEIAVLAAAIWLFVFHVSVVSGHSMDPSLEAGDRLVVDKIGCQWGPVNRFDVVVFGCPDSPGVDYVKRVVGLPGETIRLSRGDLYVNGEFVEQGFSHEREEYATYPETTLAADEYFVLGDNRPRSRDSRSFGPIRRNDIKGVVRLRVYPFGRIQTF
jgi:signal peptidase I